MTLWLAAHPGSGVASRRLVIAAAGVGPALGIETFEVRFGGMIDELHHLGDDPMARFVGDQAMHPLRDVAVRGVLVAAAGGAGGLIPWRRRTE